MNLKRRLFTLHSWLGLCCGLGLLVIFLTGSLMVFREELSARLHPELFRVGVTKTEPAYDRLYRQARTAAPEAQFYSFRRLPQAADESLEIRINERGEAGRLFVDPYNGRVLGKRFASFTDQLIVLHSTFFLKELGKLLSVLCGLALLGSVVTGFVVYRRHLLAALAFRTGIRWRNWRTASSGLHRVLGSWALVFNLVLAISGFWMSFDAFNLQKLLRDEAEKKEKALPEVRANLDALLLEARHLEPGLQVTRINFPRKPDAPVVVMGRAPGSSWLWGSAASKFEFGNVPGPPQLQKAFRERDLGPAQRLDFALRTLHFGQYGGLGVKILYSLLALSSALLSLTGYVLWWRRRQHVGRTAARRPAVPA